MEKKVLGKIETAEFGRVPDYAFLFGLQLTFAMESGGVGDGGKYTINMSKECKWGNEQEKLNAMFNLLQSVYNILRDAKVANVSDLKGIPVEITFNGIVFRDFRILTEVL